MCQFHYHISYCRIDICPDPDRENPQEWSVQRGKPRRSVRPAAGAGVTAWNHPGGDMADQVDVAALLEEEFENAVGAGQ